MIATASGALLGAFLAFLVVLIGLPPSPDDLADDAGALVLPDSDLLHVGANTGATIIVGWDRWAVADFEDERPREVVHQLMLERASEQGWAIDEVGSNQYGSWIHASGWLTHAEISLSAQLHAGKRLDSSAGEVVVSRNEERRFVLFWGFVLAGGIGGGAVGQWSEQADDPESASTTAGSGSVLPKG